MKLQLAMDTVLSSQTEAILQEIHEIIDIVEVGTPMIIREGLFPVRFLKEKFPAMEILADTKIVDGGEIECRDACLAGADIITFLAMTHDETAHAVIETAHRHGKKALADLICVADIENRAKELYRMGADYICVHTATDVKTSGRTPLGDLKRLVAAIPSANSAVAGGIDLETIDDYTALEPAIIIVGSAIMNAKSIKETAHAMKNAFKR